MQQQFDEGVDSWKSVMFLYNSALKEVSTKLEILNDEFQYVHQYNPIEYIKSRIKSPESIVKKLKKNGYESSIQNMVNYVNDIAGIRIVCSFTFLPGLELGQHLLKFRLCLLHDALCLLFLGRIEHGNVVFRHDDLGCAHVLQLLLRRKLPVVFCRIADLTAAVHHKPDALCPFCF